MSLLHLMASGRPSEPLYSDSVFSAYTYTGNGSTQTITNGIDLSGQGGMVWFKSRSAAIDHWLVDTDRTGSKGLYSNATSAQATATNSISAFNSNGFSITNASGYENSSGGASSYISWTFRKAPKFFDVVTWTGNSTPRTIAHSLGSAPGMIMVKKTNTADSWYVYHRSLGNGGVLYLEQTAAAGTGSSYWNSTDPTASVFSVGGNTGVNGTGNTYVAYLFAHDAAADGIIQCGSFTVTGGARQTINLGWEPQYLLMKSVTNADTWEVLDTSRALTTDSTAAMLQPNSSAAESPAGTSMGARITATGFTAQNSNATYIYMAIRRPNKPPTVGTQVYNAIARTGTGAAATVTGVGFAPDLAMTTDRPRANYAQPIMWDRLRGALLQLATASTTAELSVADSLTAFVMDGVSVGTSRPNASGITYINHFFKRAPGVFDVACYTTPTQTVPIVVPHSLGVTPELAIVKRRNGVGNHKVSTAGAGFALNSGAVGWSANLTLQSTSFTITTNDNDLNAAGGNYVAYLFATKAGISKVGSYTGNGSSLTLNMGFTTGARFFMCKRTDSTGDWYVFDTTRGIVSGNDGHLSLNTTAAEVTTDDSVDPDTSGLIVNQVAATNINVTSATYIYLSFS